MSQQQRILAAASYTMTGSNVEVPIGTLLSNAVHLIGVQVYVSNISGGVIQIRGAGGTTGISVPDGQGFVLENHAVADGLLYLNGTSGTVTATIYGEPR